MKQLPKEFISRMKNLLGTEYADYERAVNGLPVKAFRVNTDKISLQEFEKINPFGSIRSPFNLASIVN